MENLHRVLWNVEYKRPASEDEIIQFKENPNSDFIWVVPVLAYGSLRQGDIGYQKLIEFMVSPNPISYVVKDYIKLYNDKHCYYEAVPYPYGVLECELYYFYEDCIPIVDRYETTHYKRILYKDVAYLYILNED